MQKKKKMRTYYKVFSQMTDEIAKTKLTSKLFTVSFAFELNFFSDPHHIHNFSSFAFEI